MRGVLLALLWSFSPAVAWAQDAGLPSGGGVDSGVGPGANAGDAGPSVDGGVVVVPDHMMPGPDAPEIAAGVADGAVQVGRVFSLFITITHDAGVEVNVPSAIVYGAAFDELRRTYADSTAVDGRKVREYEIQLMAWLVGDQQLPPIEVVYVVRGQARRTQSAPVAISVVGVIGDGEEHLRDIVPPVAVERSDLTLLYVSAIAVGALLLSILAVLVLRSRRRGSRSHRARSRQAESLPLAPDARALARLEALQASGSLENDDRKPGYLELSEIVREYIGSRYSFPALDSTTSEVKGQLSVRPDGAIALESLESWLDEVDLVKYASYQPSQDVASKALGQARELVERCEQFLSCGSPEPASSGPEDDAGKPASAPMQPAGAAQDDAGDTLRGLPEQGRGQSRWEPPADYAVVDPRAKQAGSAGQSDPSAVPEAVMDAVPDTLRDSEPPAPSASAKSEQEAPATREDDRA